MAKDNPGKLTEEASHVFLGWARYCVLSALASNRGATPPEIANIIRTALPGYEMSNGQAAMAVKQLAEKGWVRNLNVTRRVERRGKPANTYEITDEGLLVIERMNQTLKKVKSLQPRPSSP